MQSFRFLLCIGQRSTKCFSAAINLVVLFTTIVTVCSFNCLGQNFTWNPSQDCILYFWDYNPAPQRLSGNTIKSRLVFVPTQRPIGNWIVHIRIRAQFRTSNGAYTTIAENQISFPQNSTSRSLFDQDLPGYTWPPFNQVETLSLLEPHGNGYWRTEYQATGICGYQSRTHTWYSSAPTVIERPSITSNGVAGMWWLNGESDPAAGLYDQALVIGDKKCNECSNSLTYSIHSTGFGRAVLTCFNCNQTNVKAQHPSDSCNARDIVVRANLDGFNAASEVLLTVNTLYDTKRTTPSPPAYPSTTSFLGGWKTIINYNLRDLCNVPVTYPVSVNEKFGSRTPNASQWSMPNVQSGTVIPFADEIAVWPTQPGNIQPTIPNSPLQNSLHDKIEMTISVGSLGSGKGLPVKITHQERYIDHGDHNDNP